MPRKKKRFDDLMEAVSFAEAGEIETARDLASEIFPEEPPEARRAARILAVSGAPGFSREMIEDSVGMAERLDYGLVALSVPPAAGGADGRPGTAPERETWLSAEAFRARAAERGIPFLHAVKSGDPERAVAEVRRRIRRIAFLLVEPDLAPRARFASVGLPVFFLAS